jgi:hypothetical protein
MGFENKIAWEEFKAEIRQQISAHPNELAEILELALRERPAEQSPTAAAKWAARWARQFWTRTGLEPPGNR